MPAATREAHLRWLREAESWGAWIRYPDDEPGAPEQIWMLRGGNGRVRFYAEGKGLVGKEHSSLMAAAYWAWANGWLWLEPDGSLDMIGQLACRREVHENGTWPGREAIGA